MQSLVIHGRQPALGRAELESIYEADKLRPVGNTATLIDIAPVEINFARLGGMVKFCKVLTVLETTNWTEIEDFLVSAAPAHFDHLPEGKLKIGLSVYNLPISPSQIHKTALRLKKAGKEAGQSVRIIPNKEKALNSATVLYNGLTKKLGWELVFVCDGQQTIVAQSIAVQDIDAYRKRDHERPCRDPRVGMLPPKLAQIIINLAAGTIKPSKNIELLDPFCGSGVLIQEAALMGFSAHGADIDPRIGDFYIRNMEWLLENYDVTGSWQLADATKSVWQTSEFNKNDVKRVPLQVDIIACETYLGRPLTSLPDQETLQRIIHDCNTIHKKFLQNIVRQTKPGFRMCIAVPAWKTKNSFKHLPVLDSLEELGYNRVKFVHATQEDLIYHRPGQIVARELVVLTRT